MKGFCDGFGASFYKFAEESFNADKFMDNETKVSVAEIFESFNKDYKMKTLLSLPFDLVQVYDNLKNCGAYNSYYDVK